MNTRHTRLESNDGTTHTTTVLSDSWQAAVHTRRDDTGAFSKAGCHVQFERNTQPDVSGLAYHEGRRISLKVGHATVVMDEETARRTRNALAQALTDAEQLREEHEEHMLDKAF